MGSLAGLLKAAGHDVRGCDSDVYPPMSTQLAEQGIAVMNGYGARQPRLGRPTWSWSATCRPRIRSRSRRRRSAGSSSPRSRRCSRSCSSRGCTRSSSPARTARRPRRRWRRSSSPTPASDPSFLVGGVPINFGRSWRLGKGDLFVVEGDEYDTAFFDKGSKFLHYRPKTAILTSVELDHVDIFSSLDAIKDAFRKFVALIPPDGLCIVAADSPGALDVAKGAAVQGRDLRRARRRASRRAGRLDRPRHRHAPRRTHAVRGHARRQAVRRLRHHAARRLQPGQRAVGDRRVGVARAHHRADRARHAPLRRRSPSPGGARRRPGRHRRRRLRAPSDGGARDACARCGVVTAAGRLIAIFEPRSATSRRAVFQKEFADAFAEADEIIVGAGQPSGEGAGGRSLRRRAARRRSARQGRRRAPRAVGRSDRRAGGVERRRRRHRRHHDLGRVRRHPRQAAVAARRRGRAGAPRGFAGGAHAPRSHRAGLRRARRARRRSARRARQRARRSSAASRSSCTTKRACCARWRRRPSGAARGSAGCSPTPRWGGRAGAAAGASTSSPRAPATSSPRSSASARCSRRWSTRRSSSRRSSARPRRTPRRWCSTCRSTGHESSWRSRVVSPRGGRDSARRRGPRARVGSQAHAVDLVTEYDKRSEAHVVAALRAAFPDDEVVAEEGGGQSGASGRRWLVDPLDGTTNFAHGLPFFCVSIGLEDASGPLVGVVDAPALGWHFFAARGARRLARRARHGRAAPRRQRHRRARRVAARHRLSLRHRAPSRATTSPSGRASIRRRRACAASAPPRSTCASSPPAGWTATGS